MAVATFKDSIRERDGLACTGCGMTQDEHIEKYGKRLEVHRKTPGRLGGKYVEENAVTLCIVCHRRADAAMHPKLPPPLRCAMRKDVKDLLDAYIDHFNDQESLNTGVGDHITRAVIKYLESKGWYPEAPSGADLPPEAK